MSPREITRRARPLRRRVAESVSRAEPFFDDDDDDSDALIQGFALWGLAPILQERR